MTLRTTLAVLLVTLVPLSGCAGGLRTKTPVAAEFTPGDEARLAELQARLELVDADSGATLTPADSSSLVESTLSADERREILVEVQRLQNERDAAAASATHGSAKLATLAVIGTVALIAVAVVAISTYEPPDPCFFACDDD